MRFVCLIPCASFALLLSCAPRAVRTSGKPADLSQTVPKPTRGIDYIDLQPGWRLRVTTPLLKSGAYRLRLNEKQVDGNTVTLSAGEDFEGYETAFYAVEPRKGGGVRIGFVSADMMKEGKSVPQVRPKELLFRLPPSTRMVRLIYLTRVSQFDHDMAVVAADETGALERLTQAVKTGQDACKSEDDSVCFWIPAGIALRPEMQTNVGGSKQWVPVQ
ncbi:MAG TPA: hypothetical protein VLE22_18320 [Bryobacteraceae bacterium]|nr:hypothetical protein [Bryobacteraceae bacterium]